MPTMLSSTKSATRTAPAITIGEYAPCTFWLVTASAACDSRRRRSIGGRSAVAVATAVAAASNIGRALFGSTVPRSVPAQHLGMRAPRRNSSLHGLTDKSEETVIVGKERLTICERVAVARQHSFDHRLLGKMNKNPLAKRLCTHQRGVGIVERGLDRVRHRAHDIGGKQRIGMGTEYLRN